MVPCRAGNYSRKVSYGSDTQCAHDGQETICEKFPVEMIHNGVMTRQETICEGFPIEMIHNGVMTRQETIREGFPMEMVHSVPMPDRKLSAKVSYGNDTQ